MQYPIFTVYTCKYIYFAQSNVYKILLTGTPGAVEGKLGKNRTEADMRRYTDERDRMEKEREEVRSSLANLKKERREIKEELSNCQGTTLSICVHRLHADL